jgi:hypothetical protein
MNYKKALVNLYGLFLTGLLLFACSVAGPDLTSPPQTFTETVAEVSPETVTTPTVRILFIGNSLTFFNDLPGMFAELAQSGGYEVDVAMSAHGGWTCSDHAESAQTLEMIAKENWDYVILQEQSRLPALVDRRSEKMYPAVRFLDEKARDSGAATVLFMTWAAKNGLPDAGYPAFVTLQDEIQTGYLEIANELDVLVAPVGAAWRSALSQDSQLNLWQADGIHPAPEGTYLAALVFYAALFLQSPEGLPYHAGLSAEVAQFMQAVAAETVLTDPARWNVY